MENLVPLGTGNSRLMKSNIPSNTTLAQLIQMWNNGTFPYDIGPLNSAGISQQGTPLNKDTLLKDATAALFGLSNTAVPDEVLNVLSRFQSGLGNEYIWEKVKFETTYSGDMEANAGGSENIPVSIQLNQTIMYGDNPPTVDEDTGEVSIVGGTSLYLTSAGQLNGKISDGTYVLYAYEGNQLATKWSGTPNQFSNLNGVTAEIKGAHFTSYSITVTPYTVIASYGYVNSPDSDAYPPAVPDEYTYFSLGKLGQAAHIETGTYVGTGTYGSSNPNTLTFGFVPSLVIISYRLNASRVAGVVQGIFTPAIYTSAYSDMGYCYAFNSSNKNCFAKISGNTLHWYANTASLQLNTSGQTFSYTAIR